MRILFIGDIVGRSGRTIVNERLPGLIADVEARSRRHQRRERRRRFRHHRSHLQRVDRRRRRRHHARQSRLGSARGAGLHRARAAADPPGQLSQGHARPRRRHGRHQERQARAGHQRHGPHLHGCDGRSLRRGRARARRLRAQARAPTPSSSTCIARRPARNSRWDFSSTAASAWWSARTPMSPTADHRIMPGRHRLRVRCRHDRRFRIGDRHEQRRAAQPFPAQAAGLEIRAGQWARDAVRHRGRNRRR